VDVDAGLEYLAQTRSILNFDTSIQIPTSMAVQDYARWLKLPKDLYDPGGWTKYMPTTGGRGEIGPYPEWVTKWLYRGDSQYLEIVSTMADLAAAWPLAIREGNAAKHFDAAGRIGAIGRPLSIYARPTLHLFDSEDLGEPQDRVTIQGPRLEYGGAKRNGGWFNDAAHQPDPYSALYTLTGDFWALEQMQFWAASQAVSFVVPYKGPAPSGGIIGQIRGDAWVLRNRVHAAYLSPDGSPEKNYFTAIINDALAVWEGHHDIHGTKFEGTPQWRFGQTRLLVNPLHAFDDQPARGDGGVKLDIVGTTTAIWTDYFLLLELGRAKEKGFPAGPMLSWLAVVLTSQFAHPDSYDPANLQRFQTPIRRRDGTPFKTWAETMAGYINPVPGQLNGGCEGIARMAYAASTMLATEPGGREAYDWLRKNMYDKFTNLNFACPKWSLLPRA
jgi:hypothetical protein